MLKPNNQSNLPVFDHELDERQRKHLNETRKKWLYQGIQGKDSDNYDW